MSDPHLHLHVLPPSVPPCPASELLLSDGVRGRCCVALLAGTAVGALFVGSVASTLALSEVLRLLHGGAVHQLVDIDLLGLDQRLVSRHPNDFSDLNPGFTMAKIGRAHV